MLRHYKTKSGFLKELSEDTIISHEDICFIEESRQIYTHGTYYAATLDEDKIYVEEGKSDRDGYIVSDVQVPEGYEAEVISRMFHHPKTNMWVTCIGYKAAGGSSHIVTGEYKIGVSVVVGVSTVESYGECTYRTYYRLKKIIQ